MLSFRVNLTFFLTATLLATPAFASHVHRAPTAGSTHHHRSHHVSLRRNSHRLHGQQAIEPERVTQIQQALIREHYLTGNADGQWNDTTIDAMRKFQADHGWQTKLVPDSRALVKLGLGPDYSNAINAKNSSFAAPPPVSTIPAAQEEGFAAASGVDQ